MGVEGVRHLLARIHKAVRDRVSRILRNTFLNTFVYAILLYNDVKQAMFLIRVSR